MGVIIVACVTTFIHFCHFETSLVSSIWLEPVCIHYCFIRKSVLLFYNFRVLCCTHCSIPSGPFVMISPHAREKEELLHRNLLCELYWKAFFNIEISYSCILICPVQLNWFVSWFWVREKIPWLWCVCLTSIPEPPTPWLLCGLQWVAGSDALAPSSFAESALGPFLFPNSWLHLFPVSPINPAWLLRI